MGPSLPPALESPVGACRGWDLLLITLDTLRADRLGCYGDLRVGTAELDSLAAGGVLLGDAVSPVPITLPSHATILTGTGPETHGVRDNGTFRLAQGASTLAERLAPAGYHRAAFVAAFVLDRRFGLDQGFQFYDDRMPLEEPSRKRRLDSAERRGDNVVDQTATWLQGSTAPAPESPLFLWVHLFDPHQPYDPPAPYDRLRPTEPYSGEVAFLDRQIGRLRRSVVRSRPGRPILTVVVGDHGEGLGDHVELFHGLLLNEETVRVPILLHAPGALPAGRLVADRVTATTDLAPTILDLLGIESDGMDGVSLLRQAPSDRAVYLETWMPALRYGWSSLRALRSHRAKYVEAPRPECYDLAADPGERQSLPPKPSSEGGRLRKALPAAPAPPAPDAAEARQPSAEEIEALASLGYVDGPARPAGATAPVGPDPKDMVGPWQSRGLAIQRILFEEDPTEGIPLIRALLEDLPEDVELWTVLALGYLQAGNLDEAVRCQEEAVRLRPSDRELRRNLDRFRQAREAGG